MVIFLNKRLLDSGTKKEIEAWKVKHLRPKSFIEVVLNYFNGNAK